MHASLNFGPPWLSSLATYGLCRHCGGKKEVALLKAPSEIFKDDPMHQHCQPQILNARYMANIIALFHQVATADIKMSCPVKKGSTALKKKKK